MVCTVVHSHTLPATNKHRYYLFSEQMNKCFFHVCSRSHSTIIFFLHHQHLASSSFSSSSCAMIYDSTNMTMAMLCLFVACMCAVRVSFRIANSQRKKHQTQLNKKKKNTNKKEEEWNEADYIILHMKIWRWRRLTSIIADTHTQKCIHFVTHSTRTMSKYCLLANWPIAIV